ncbi:16S rRNA (adenine(1518)-N(6)/adenine(1519)-N(6))-dimethyltransferase RsmA [Suttonella sp. R2A3]|nr:16S rRNA (adenine(1518)-N(6)/adenine(1519)-N(6))-dimethyltransferase RsmA [Suttonella sp. R2A3]UJF25388.1 16S rRNA (adenine(1518)-N(6)/adenine(1519)-N(6))-dimethyltransferase RsmA [Suttonella sp. R2A3]
MAEVRAAKHLGQHFLVDERVIDQLVSAIDPRAGESLVEIGPGLGALTLPLLRESGAMSAIEFDRRVLEPLQIKADRIGQLNLINADILQVDFTSLGLASPLKVVGNLPYNLSSPIIFHCLAQRNLISDMVFMLQKEVVERVCAEPGSKAYGRLSIMVQLYCACEALFDIAPDAFDPPPKVDSAVVRLTPLAEPAWHVEDFARFDELVRAAFTQRRKMVRKSLQQYFSAEDFAVLGIDPTARPETLSGEAFARLADYRRTS